MDSNIIATIICSTIAVVFKFSNGYAVVVDPIDRSMNYTIHELQQGNAPHDGSDWHRIATSNEAWGKVMSRLRGDSAGNQYCLSYDTLTWADGVPAEIFVA